MDGFVSGGYVVGASGSAEDNHVVVESGRVNDFIYGGNIGGTTPTGHATGNTVEIAGGVIGASVYGGYNNGSGNVTFNAVTVTGGEIHGSVIGGDTSGSGNATGNTVTITGGEIRDDVYGGFNDGGSGTISGNILNVKASASAQNIHKFDKINFYFSGREHTEPVAQGRQCAPRARLSLRIEGGQPRQLRSEHQRLAGQASGHHGRTLRQVGVLTTAIASPAGAGEVASKASRKGRHEQAITLYRETVARSCYDACSSFFVMLLFVFPERSKPPFHRFAVYTSRAQAPPPLRRGRLLDNDILASAAGAGEVASKASRKGCHERCS